MTHTQAAIVSPAIDAAILTACRKLIKINQAIDELQLDLFKLAIACDTPKAGGTEPGKLAAANAEVTGNAIEQKPFEYVERYRCPECRCWVKGKKPERG